MPKKTAIKITERDEELLKMLGRFCALTTTEAGRIYNTKKYHQSRITALSKKKFVRRGKNIIYLGEAGKRYLEKKGEVYRQVPSVKLAKERYTKIAAIYLDFAGSAWDFIPSWEFKQGTMSYRGDRLYGVLEGRSRYAVYNIGERPRKESLYAIKREMEKLPIAYEISRVVIFYESEVAKEAYVDEILGLDEQLLLPYNEAGIALMQAYGRENLIKKAAQLTFEHGGPPKWSSADFTVDNGKQAIVLVLNDVEKKAKIKQYYELTQYRLTDRRPIAIICLEEQAEEYAEQFPECEIRTVKVEDLIGHNVQEGNNRPVSIEAEL